MPSHTAIAPAIPPTMTPKIVDWMAPINGPRAAVDPRGGLGQTTEIDEQPDQHRGAGQQTTDQPDDRTSTHPSTPPWATRLRRIGTNLKISTGGHTEATENCESE